jgi:nitroreductase
MIIEIFFLEFILKFTELSKNRYSCRKYKELIPEENKILQVIEAGRIAPSASNKQPWHFILIRKSENLEKIKSLYKRDWFANVPAVIVICGDHNLSWKRFDGKDHCDIDVAIAVDHMTLQAAELGLATCWVCNFDKEQCVKLLKIPYGIEPIVILPIGYPDDSSVPDRHSVKRKPLYEILHYDSFETRDNT